MTATSETPPAQPSPSGPNRPPRRRQQSALANPVLIGAVTVLVILIAVFLAYNANNGLPFVPTRELKVDIASGSDLVPGTRSARAASDRRRVGAGADGAGHGRSPRS